MHTNPSRPLLVALLLAPLGACTSEGVYVADDLDFELQVAPGEPDDLLHLPYVQGTEVRLRPGIVDHEDDDSTAGYRLQSSDPGVLAPSGDADPSSGAQVFVAVAAGTTTVEVLDPDGEEVHSAEITVRAPTRAELYPSGPELLPLGGARVTLERAQILDGGTATFLVHYFDGDTWLHGNGVLTASSDAGVALEPTTSYLFENREWIQITPTGLGTHDIALEADGIAIGTFEIEVVPASAVADIELQGQDESEASEGDSLSVLARATDADGDPIFGVACQWDVDGVEELGDGDVYRYSFAGEMPVTLGASFGDLHTDAVIHAGDGWVSSTNEIGCSAAPGAGASSALALPLALAALALVRRRRSA